MRRASSALLLGLLVAPALAAASSPAPAEWATAAARLPAPLESAAAVWDGTHVVVLGGITDAGPTDVVLGYDPHVDALVDLGARLPRPTSRAAAVWTGEEVLLFGGHDGDAFLDNVTRFDPASGEVNGSAARFPVPLAGASAAWDPRDRPDAGCAGGCAYVFGGRTASGFSDLVLRYNPATDSVIVADARLPRACAYSAAAWDGALSRVYVAGCYVGGYAEVACDDGVYAYDPAADAMTTTALRVPDARYAAGAFWTGEAVALVGGLTCDSRSPTDVLLLKPETGAYAYASASLPEGRSGVALAWVGDAAYAVGGSTVAANGSGARRDTVLRLGDAPSAKLWFPVTSSEEAPTTHPDRFHSPLMAAFEFTPRVPTVGEAVSFRDTSRTGVGAVVAWRWEFGNPAGCAYRNPTSEAPACGPTSGTQHPTHAFDVAGPVGVRLTVTDSAGRTATAQAIVEVAPVAERATEPATEDDARVTISIPVAGAGAALVALGVSAALAALGATRRL